MRAVVFAACLVVAFLAVGWLGMQLAGDAEAEPGRNGLSPPTTAVEVAAPTALRRSRTWAERASASCARGLEDTRALVNEAPFTTEPGATEHEFLLELLDATVRVEGRVVRELDALPVRRAERREVRDVVRLLDEERRSGADLIAALRVRWDDALLDRKLRANERTGGRLRLLFLGLGATGCAAYLQG